MIRVGELIRIGWEGATRLGVGIEAGTEVRVEAVGADWIVVRKGGHLPYSATFVGTLTPSEMIDELGELVCEQ